MPPPTPTPAYPPSNPEALYGDAALYARLNSLVENHAEVEQVSQEHRIVGEEKYEVYRGSSPLEEVGNLEVPIRSGRAWKVGKGQLCTLSLPEGAQVGDLNMWSLSNPRERFWAARTRQLHATHMKVGDRFWSNLPYLRPLATIVGDSLKDYGVRKDADGKGVDEHGGRVHDLLGTRCDPYVNKLLADSDFDYHCHSNLTRAVLPWGLNESDVHDVLNVFQVTGTTPEGKYYMSPCPGKKGDYFTFFAETDLLCAIATCPGGDLSVYGWGEDAAARMLATCNPIDVNIYEVKDKSILDGWEESKVANWGAGLAAQDRSMAMVKGKKLGREKEGYGGFHGLRGLDYSVNEQEIADKKKRMNELLDKE